MKNVIRNAALMLVVSASGLAAQERSAAVQDTYDMDAYTKCAPLYHVLSQMAGQNGMREHEASLRDLSTALLYRSVGLRQRLDHAEDSTALRETLYDAERHLEGYLAQLDSVAQLGLPFSASDPLRVRHEFCDDFVSGVPKDPESDAGG